MRVHDFHLRGYSVLDSGTRIVLDLVYDYPGVEAQQSTIEFSDVVCYHFNHTTGAIITNIEEVDLNDLVKEEAALLKSLAHAHDLSHWRTDAAEYAEALMSSRMRAWRLESAIGFSALSLAAMSWRHHDRARRLPNKPLQPIAAKTRLRLNGGVGLKHGRSKAIHSARQA